MISEFDCSEADTALASCFARVQLPERDHGLAVALLVEGHGHPESIRVVVYVLPVIENRILCFSECIGLWVAISSMLIYRLPWVRGLPDGVGLTLSPVPADVGAAVRSAGQAFRDR